MGAVVGGVAIVGHGVSFPDRQVGDRSLRVEERRLVGEVWVVGVVGGERGHPVVPRHIHSQAGIGWNWLKKKEGYTVSVLVHKTNVNF